MTEPNPPPDPLATLLHRAVELDEAERRAARNQFLWRIDRELAQARAPRQSWSFGLLRYAAPLALAAVVLLGLFAWQGAAWFRQGDHDFDYTVSGAVRDGQHVRAALESPAHISFLDRTQIHASPGSSLRIDDNAEGDGARVLLERGTLEVAVTHTGDANWQFRAGPFEVRVTGTRFTLSWEADKARLELALQEGSVDVAFGNSAGRSRVVSVRAGQRLVGDAQQGKLIVTDISAGTPSASPVPASPPNKVQSTAPQPDAASLPEPIPAGSSRPQRTLAPGASVSEPEPSWPALVSQGGFRNVVDQATTRGIGKCLASCSAEDLSALADAARYVGQGELAERTLLALRARFATAYGARSAFLLGRLHESKGALAGARTWYETALREGRGGAFAPEALAGKMRAVSGLEGRAAARDVAREYLRLYPKGAHAAAAQQIVEGR